MFRWFWRFLAMAILAGMVALLSHWSGDAIFAGGHWQRLSWLITTLDYFEVLAMLGAAVAIIGAGLTGLVWAVLFIFRKAMES